MRHAIGAGALGPVFRAHEADTDRDVAVKLFRVNLAPERVHALVADLERMIGAGLSHPSLVTPVAAGIAGTHAYLVEELVEGKSLDVFLRDRGPVAPPAALRLVAQLAAALDAGAARGFLHGSLHPRDVLAADGETARLTGVGVAQALELAGADLPVRRPYAAPERVAGMRWDRRADIFGLAAITHELICGRRIVGVGEQVAGTLPEIAGADAAALRRVFAQALAPSPGDRFETAGAFAATLAECFEGGREVVHAAVPRRRIEPTPAQSPPDRTPVPPTPALSRLPFEGVDAQSVDGPLRPRMSFSTEPSSVDLDLPLTPPPAPSQPLSPESRSSASSPAVSKASPSSAARSSSPAPPSSSVPSSSSSTSPSPSDAAPVPGKHQPEPAVVVRPRDGSLERPLAPVRIEMGTPQREDPHTGRRPRGAERSAAAPSAPEQPLPLPLDGAEPSRSPFLSLGLTAVVFLSLGFAGGYWVASSRVEAPASVVASSPSERVAREPAEMTATPLVPEPPLPEPVSPESQPPAQVARAAGSATPAPPVSNDEQSPSRDETASNADRAAPPAPASPAAQTPPRASTASSSVAPQSRQAAPQAAAGPPAARAAAAPRTGVLQIESRPSGANVYINGRLRGRTPLQLGDVLAAEYGVRLQLDGYTEWLTAVRVQPGGRHRVAASLEPRP